MVFFVCIDRTTHTRICGSSGNDSVANVTGWTRLACAAAGGCFEKPRRTCGAIHSLVQAGKARPALARVRRRRSRRRLGVCRACQALAVLHKAVEVTLEALRCARRPWSGLVPSGRTCNAYRIPRRCLIRPVWTPHTLPSMKTKARITLTRTRVNATACRDTVGRTRLARNRPRDVLVCVDRTRVACRASSN